MKVPITTDRYQLGRRASEGFLIWDYVMQDVCRLPDEAGVLKTLTFDSKHEAMTWLGMCRAAGLEMKCTAVIDKGSGLPLIYRSRPYKGGTLAWAF
ncbi:hypothetical protein [Kitasatospora aureofaciens]|uniref:hypothetical protein n=1 Tax=Kitasatospora aureofaciens TaxID=1894 RepID=UPI0033F00AAE